MQWLNVGDTVYTEPPEATSRDEWLPATVAEITANRITLSRGECRVTLPWADINKPEVQWQAKWEKA